MGKFSEIGLAGFCLSMAELAKLPDSVKSDMLIAGGRVIKEYQEREIAAKGLVKTGRMKASITVQPYGFVREKDGTCFISVYPYGDHHTYKGRLKTGAYKRSKHGRTYSFGGKQKVTTNNDVAFIHEVGAPKRHIKASKWMSSANEKAQSAVIAAQEKVYNAYLNKLGL